ncbi:hypothetical protein I4F81_005758 [Pyropia yezoensis]|uniref:Uncharacterized protein n=1 Tax=Pyropia yezoensis TaxID=2788 RepID=A0ACC3BZ72_PYRYE|nr:hypothetical protein I4F81_005758 [Neopyropia yezoensis]
MRAVVQRVAQASVTGGGKTAAIGKGLCVLVGFAQDDAAADVDHVIKKLLSLRVFDRALAPGQDGVDADGDAAGRTPSAQRWASNVVDIQGEILLGALGRWGSAGGRRFRCLWAPLFPVWVSAMWCPLVVLTGSLLGTDWLRGRAACCGPVDAFGDGPAASSRDGL